MREEHKRMSRDNVYNAVDIIIEDNILKFAKEGIQISNISQFRVDREPAKVYPYSLIATVIALIVAMFYIPVLTNVLLLIVLVPVVMLIRIWIYNANREYYLILEMNSGRVCYFASRKADFLEVAKDALIECFNKTNSKFVINFAECNVRDFNIGDNNSINKKGDL